MVPHTCSYLVTPVVPQMAGRLPSWVFFISNYVQVVTPPWYPLGESAFPISWCGSIAHGQLLQGAAKSTQAAEGARICPLASYPAAWQGVAFPSAW